jgi:hypothetical protein
LQPSSQAQQSGSLSVFASTTLGSPEKYQLHQRIHGLPSLVGIYPEIAVAKQIISNVTRSDQMNIIGTAFFCLQLEPKLNKVVRFILIDFLLIIGKVGLLIHEFHCFL